MCMETEENHVDGRSSIGPDMPVSLVPGLLLVASCQITNFLLERQVRLKNDALTTTPTTQSQQIDG